MWSASCTGWATHRTHEKKIFSHTLSVSVNEWVTMLGHERRTERHGLWICMLISSLVSAWLREWDSMDATFCATFFLSFFRILVFAREKHRERREKQLPVGYTPIMKALCSCHTHSSSSSSSLVERVVQCKSLEEQRDGKNTTVERKESEDEEQLSGFACFVPLLSLTLLLAIYLSTQSSFFPWRVLLLLLFFLSHDESGTRTTCSWLRLIWLPTVLLSVRHDDDTTDRKEHMDCNSSSSRFFSFSFSLQEKEMWDAFRLMYLSSLPLVQRRWIRRKKYEYLVQQKLMAQHMLSDFFYSLFWSSCEFHFHASFSLSPISRLTCSPCTGKIRSRYAKESEKRDREKK